MKKTRLLSTALVSLLLTSNIAITTFAKNNNSNVIPKEVYDTAKVNSKTFSPMMIPNDDGTYPSFLSSYEERTYTANCKISRPFFGTWSASAWSDSYVDETKTSKSPIDRIMANARLYKDNVLISEKKDDRQNSSHAGVACSNPSNAWSNTELYGSHAFEEADCQAWYPETYESAD